MPSVALLVLWGLSTAQLGLDWLKLAEQDALTDRSAALARGVTLQLQEERRLTGLVIADGSASKDAMLAQRKRTDEAVRAFEDATAGRPSPRLRPQLRDALAKERTAVRQVGGVRASVDEGTATDEVAFQSFTGIIESGLGFFEALGNADDGELAAAFKPLTDLMWADEMLSREDAVLCYSWASGSIRQDDRSNFSQWIGTQNFLLDSEVTPRVTEEERDGLQDLTGSDAWQTKSAVEAALVGHHPMDTAGLPRTSGQWRQAMRTVQPRFAAVVRQRAEVTDDVTGDAVGELKVRMRTYGAICLGTVLVVIVLSVLLSGSLRRRILALRDEAARLETELPEVMERLRGGEDVDVDAEVREIPYRRDELGRLGLALNLARRAAVETAVRETEQHRGFQRMLQRIARRTQLLIGLQLKKLDEMERSQEDPQILEGLFDLDHLTSRLRRYEENLVVLGGGQPQRRWRNPVRVVDVLRAALGEVQDYRRIQIEVTQEPWLSGRAVGPLVHILAELMENAAAFSKPPNPVEARAGAVGRGLAVEIEDRGIGMDPEGYDTVNRLMAKPPQLDVLSRAEDARLGLYVVARLASDLGLQVEFRPSAYGGTRVIVMVPAELVAEAPAPGAADVETPISSRARLRAANTPDGTGRHRAVRREDGAAADALTPARHRAAQPHTTGQGHQAAGEPAGTPAPAPAGRRSAHARAGIAAPPGPVHTAPGPDLPQMPGPAAGAAREGGADPVPAAAVPAGSAPPADRTTRDDAFARGVPSWVRTLPGPASGDAPGPTAAADAAGPVPTAPRPGGPRSLPAPGAAALLGLPIRARGQARGPGIPTSSAGSGPPPRGPGGPPGPRPLPSRPPGTPPAPAPGPGPAPSGEGPGPLSPLPRRVRQASLAPELKDPRRGLRRPGGADGRAPQDNPRPERSGAAIGAFQRQSRRSRGLPQPAAPPTTGAPAPGSRPTSTEDAP
ncbi:histidine kinase [Streptomyces sulfonofaciens]|uniref:histidine kinase n=1 Tax=Streptomyces sulfonofaciens TaxID=68272 RepID=A0A919GDE4_9ACTN|nr:histidine kinase [Streptomyces sulfonofaciens]